MLSRKNYVFMNNDDGTDNNSNRVRHRKWQKATDLNKFFSYALQEEKSFFLFHSIGDFKLFNRVHKADYKF